MKTQKAENNLSTEAFRKHTGHTWVWISSAQVGSSVISQPVIVPTRCVLFPLFQSAGLKPILWISGSDINTQ